MDLIERYCGALLGLAAGDALGTTLEFQPQGSFEPVTDMIGGGPSAWPRGSGPTIPPWRSASRRA